MSSSDAAHAHPEGSASSKTWAAVGTVLSIMLAVVVMFWIIGALLNPTASGLQQIADGLKLVNKAIYGVRGESNLLLINLFQFVVLPAILFVVFKYWVLK